MPDFRISDLLVGEESTAKSGTVRPWFGLNRQPGFGNDCGEGQEIKALQESLYWVLEYIRRVPDIRRDEVKEMRRRISSGSWNPKSKRIADKILDEHLPIPKAHRQV